MKFSRSRLVDDDPKKQESETEGSNDPNKIIVADTKISNFGILIQGMYSV